MPCRRVMRLNGAIVVLFEQECGRSREARVVQAVDTAIPVAAQRHQVSLHKGFPSPLHTGANEYVTLRTHSSRPSLMTFAWNGIARQRAVPFLLAEHDRAQHRLGL
jgi:hypothetical protein